MCQWFGGYYRLIALHTLVRLPSLVEMRPKSLHVTGMFLACNMQGFGMFAMHVCMFSMHVACDMHTTLYSQYCDMHVSLNMHGSCM